MRNAWSLHIERVVVAQVTFSQVVQNRVERFAWSNCTANVLMMSRKPPASTVDTTFLQEMMYSTGSYRTMMTADSIAWPVG